MAYRSPAVLGGADRGETLVRLTHELAVRRDELGVAEREAADARARAEAIGDRTDEEVALAEEARRRALLLELGKTGAEHGHLRDALKSERRARELRLAIARAKSAVSERPPPSAVASKPETPPDLEAAQSALAIAREERAKRRADAEIAARGAESRARDLARVVDELEREVERLRGGAA